MTKVVLGGIVHQTKQSDLTPRQIGILQRFENSPYTWLSYAPVGLPYYPNGAPDFRDDEIPELNDLEAMGLLIGRDTLWGAEWSITDVGRAALMSNKQTKQEALTPLDPSALQWLTQLRNGNITVSPSDIGLVALDALTRTPYASEIAGTNNLEEMGYRTFQITEAGIEYLQENGKMQKQGGLSPVQISLMQQIARYSIGTWQASANYSDLSYLLQMGFLTGAISTPDTLQLTKSGYDALEANDAGLDNNPFDAAAARQIAGKQQKGYSKWYDLGVRYASDPGARNDLSEERNIRQRLDTAIAVGEFREFDGPPDVYATELNAAMDDFMQGIRDTWERMGYNQPGGTNPYKQQRSSLNELKAALEAKAVKTLTAEDIDALGFYQSNILWQVINEGYIMVDNPSRNGPEFMAAIEDLVSKGYLVARHNSFGQTGYFLSMRISSDVVGLSKSAKMATWEDWIDILTGAPGSNSSLINQAMHEVAQYIVDLVGGDEYTIANWVRQNVQESDRDFPDGLVRRWQSSQGKSARSITKVLLGGIVHEIPEKRKVMYNGRDITSWDDLSWYEAMSIYQSGNHGDPLYDLAFEQIYRVVLNNVQSDPGFLRSFLSDPYYSPSTDPATIAIMYDKKNGLTAENGRNSHLYRD